MGNSFYSSSPDYLGKFFRQNTEVEEHELLIFIMHPLIWDSVINR